MNKETINILGKDVSISGKIENGVTLVNMRELVTAMGMYVSYDASTKKKYITKEPPVAPKIKLNDKYNIIFIDDGHGEATSGKRTPLFDDGTYMKENEFNDATAKYLINNLNNYDVEIYPVASEKEDISLEIRVNRANKRYNEVCAKYGKDKVKAIYISIHANANTGSWNTANGIETYYYKGDTAGYTLASLIQKELISSTGLRDRGCKTTDSFYVIRKTNMTAILAECGFMDNKEEAKLLVSDSYRRLCANALCNGATAYLKKY